MTEDVDDTSRLPTATAKDVLAGRSAGVSKLQALSILERRDDADKHLLFARVLRNHDEEARVRSRAAKLLAASSHQRRSQVLVEQLATESDSIVIDGLLLALTFSGDHAAYDAIERLERRIDRPFLQQRAVLAKRLIAFRHDMDDLTLDRADQDRVLELPKDASRFGLEPMGRVAAGQARRDLVRGLHAVDPSAAHSWEVACREERWVLMLNSELAVAGKQPALERRKWILAVVGFADELIEDFTPRFHILSQPDPRRRGQVTLHGIDEVGSRVLDGDGTFDGSELTFELASLEADGMFPCRMHGRLDTGTWELHEFSGRSSSEEFAAARTIQVLEPTTE